MCHLGQCVSNCNPPCGSGQECREGECYLAPVPPPPPEPGFETHDGFMLRFTAGLGYGAALASGDDDYTFGGVSGGFSFDIGGAVNENLVLHARFSDMPLIDPIVYLDGDQTAREIDDAIGTGMLFGPALSYYFMPANVYLTVAIGLSWLARASERTGVDDSDAGFGTNLDIGKEWWVSTNWGLGIAARFWYSHTSEENVERQDVKYDMLGFGILFSATYN